jgi:hypothetical protein
LKLIVAALLLRGQAVAEALKGMPNLELFSAYDTGLGVEGRLGAGEELVGGYDGGQE